MFLLFISAKGSANFELKLDDRKSLFSPPNHRTLEFRGMDDDIITKDFPLPHKKALPEKRNVAL